MEKLEPSYATGGNVNGAAIVEKSLAAPQKVKSAELLYDPAFPLLGGCPRAMNKYFDVSVHSSTKAGNNTSTRQLMDG